MIFLHTIKVAGYPGISFLTDIYSTFLLGAQTLSTHLVRPYDIVVSYDYPTTITRLL